MSDGLHLDGEELLCLRCNAMSFSSSFANKPEDVVVGIGQDKLSLAVDDTAVGVGEIVADEFRSFHAERSEAVAGAQGTENEREGKFGEQANVRR